MLTSAALTSSTPGTQSPSKTSNMQLKTEDFVKLMITQLQQQDPTAPAKSDQLLSQMSQIGQLQSSTQLQDSLKGLDQQNQIGAAAGLIGKSVQGLDANNNTISGTVQSIQVAGDQVNLQLDTAQTLSLGRVTTIATAAAKAA